MHQNSSYCGYLHRRRVECSPARLVDYRFGAVDEVDACTASDGDGNGDRTDDNENVGGWNDDYGDVERVDGVANVVAIGGDVVVVWDASVDSWRPGRGVEQHENAALAGNAVLAVRDENAASAVMDENDASAVMDEIAVARVDATAAAAVIAVDVGVVAVLE